MKTKLSQGILLAILAAIVSGFSIFYNKLVLVKGIDPLIFNVLKNGGVALLLSGLLVMRGQLPKLLSLSKKQWLKLWLIAIIGGSLPFVLYFEGLQSVSAINANLIQKTLFIWVAMLAVPFLGERLSKIQIIGYSVVAWSNLFIGGFSGISWSRAEAMILIATLLWSLENIIAKITLKDLDSTLVVWARMFLGGVILTSIALFQGKIGLLIKVHPDQLLVICGSIALLTMYVRFWYKALALAPATLVTSILILATPITNVLSAVFVTHAIAMPQLINLIGTALGLYLVTLFSKALGNTKKIVAS